MAYTAPITEIEFCLKEIARIGDLAGLPGTSDCTRRLLCRNVAGVRAWPVAGYH